MFAFSMYYAAEAQEICVYSAPVSHPDLFKVAIQLKSRFSLWKKVSGSPFSMYYAAEAQETLFTYITFLELHMDTYWIFGYWIPTQLTELLEDGCGRISVLRCVAFLCERDTADKELLMRLMELYCCVLAKDYNTRTSARQCLGGIKMRPQNRPLASAGMFNSS
ncbi:hypothetical protein CEXT_592811 [Caerostris extrusa]|uniref:Uncharacterized protein n=1 Tax=Caerostris extrusa TaxID=172846 RepID=A0AAV4UMQ8_CAEEX|nr:hypothetical protein CEXT_592811 [Caerostris extrusa]